ncbi:uncharacterized protein LOC111023359 [Momordica charantia]|uniref:Uncharacterized protein LOC111023359 n=1 Tax=Momordica charantia TaxID=3673 RepID=A0A6J1DV21_MOMCH|nr:uncharacterized protein LOC111023359 [Momordica charantia]
MESSTSEASMEVQHQKIYALLDFVMECCRNHRLISRMVEPENSFVSIMKDAVLDSALIVDTLTVLSTNEDEIVNVPKEHVVLVDSLPKFHPPRKGFSAIRSFPPGCGTGAPRVRTQHGSKCLQNNSSRTKKRHWYGASTKVAKKLNAASYSGANPCKSWLQSPITSRTESEDHNLLEDTTRKATGNEDINIGGKFSRQFDDEKSEGGILVATGPESMEKRVVVQALTAAPNCPWRQSKRICKSKPTKRICEGEELQDL